MKSKLSIKKIIFYYAIILVALLLALILTFYKFFFKQWNYAQPLTLLGFILIMIAFYFLVYNFTYYEITRKYVIFHRLGKKLTYYYSDIVYINEKRSMKKHVVSFYTTNNKSHYLIFDQKNLLYETILKHANNRLDDEEFKRKYPKVDV